MSGDLEVKEGKVGMTKLGKRNLIYALGLIILTVVVVRLSWNDYKKGKRIEKVEISVMRSDTNDVNMVNGINNVGFNIGAIVRYYEKEVGVSSDSVFAFVVSERQKRIKEQKKEADKKDVEGLSVEELEELLKEKKGVEEEEGG